MVAPYSGDMFAIVALSAKDKSLIPSPVCKMIGLEACMSCYISLVIELLADCCSFIVDRLTIKLNKLANNFMLPQRLSHSY